MAGNQSQQLADFYTAYNSIDHATEPPSTTLEIVKAHYDEDHWNRLCSYFLDSSEPHGFGVDVLTQLLSVIERECGSFHFDRHSVDDVRVDREVSTPTDNRADIVLRYGTEWFVWIEIKVRSTEGDRQTTRYVNDEYVGNILKSEFEEEGQYVYLAPAENSPDNDGFADLDWSHVLDAFRPIQQSGVSEYPFRSYVQFIDFLDTIENEIGMTQHKENQREKVELAIKYYDAIEDVRDTYQEEISAHQEEWGKRFEPHAPPGWDENWQYHTGKKKLTFYKRDWIIGDVPPGEDVKKDAPLRPYFQHVLDTELIASGQLRFKTQLTGSDSDLRREFQEYMYSDEGQDRLQRMARDIEERRDCDVSLIDRDEKTYTRFTVTNYSFEWKGGEGYYQKLRQAINDHREVITIYDEAIDQLRSN